MPNPVDFAHRFDDTVRMSMVETIADREVVLCVGPGGVGKTTTSAALGLAAATTPRRVLVLTIDPARRLADALGLGLDTEPRQIPADQLAKTGLAIRGELWAMMLDPVRTMDDLIHRLAPDPATANRLMKNIIYRQLSRALAGTIEYTAVEKIFDLRQRFGFDLIVVDTPPSKNVLDFVEAPEWAARFLDERILKWFLILDPHAPQGGFGRNILKRTGRVLWDMLSRIFGSDFLGELTEFMHAIETIAAEFRHRALVIQQLLRSSQSLFFVVSNTDDFVLNDAAYLHREISRRGIPFGGFVVNRVRTASGLSRPEHAASFIRAAGADDPAIERLTNRLVETCAELDRAAERDQRAIAQLRTETDWNGRVATLPRQSEEINDLPALARLAELLL